MRITLADGTTLPPIPAELAVYSHIVVYQTETIFDPDLGPIYMIYGTNAQPETFEYIVSESLGITSVVHGLSSSAEYYYGTGYQTDAEWQLSPTMDTGAFHNDLDWVVWANYDVFNLDGTLYLAASDPVPVTQLNPAALMQGFFGMLGVRRCRT